MGYHRPPRSAVIERLEGRPYRCVSGDAPSVRPGVPDEASASCQPPRCPNPATSRPVSSPRRACWTMVYEHGLQATHCAELPACRGRVALTEGRPLVAGLQLFTRVGNSWIKGAGCESEGRQ